MLKNLVAQVRLRDYLNGLTGANATAADNVFKEFANRMYGTTKQEKMMQIYGQASRIK